MGFLRLVLEAVFGGKRRKKMVRGSSSSGGAVVRGGSSVKQRGFSMNPKDYKLMEEVGHGASAVVYRAIYLPTNEVIAVKCLDLDRCNSNLDDVRRESQTMSLIDHPNVIKSFCSFSVDHSLWVVMPFMAQGSCLHLMKTAYSDGFEESAICSILKETLKALDYLHKQGHIHRDVKAGNILLDDNGEIKLGDFGVSACLFDNGDRQRARNTFVGTPCWMAPEVLQPGNGYNSKADIWSFGITALELAHGHAPFSKYPPMKVLLMTIQNAPPGLDYDRDKKFSKSFKEMVAMCLVKDQTKRPTAEKLLKHSCFKNTKPPELAVKSLFADLPPLWTRVKSLQAKDAAQLALKRMATADEEAISMSEYQRGVSAWNFDVKDLKTQASLLSDDDGLEESQEDEEIFHTRFHNKVNDSPVLYENMNGKEKVSTTEVEEPNCEEKFTFITNASSVTPNSEHEVPEAKANKPVRRQSQSGPLTSRAVVSASEKGQMFERSESEHQAAPSVKRAPSFSGPLNLSTRASSNSLSAPIKYSGGFRDSLDEKSKGNLVQKGRFSVTSGNLDLAKDVPLSIVPRRSPQVCYSSLFSIIVDLMISSPHLINHTLNFQSSPLRKSASVGNWIPEPKMPTVQPQTIKELSSQPMSPSLIIPQLQHIFQQNSVQQDLLMNLLSSVQSAETMDGSQSGKLPPLPRSETNGTVDSVPSERERMLLSSISELRAKLNDLTEELDSEKSRYNQLQQKLKAFTGRELV
ncbi:serine/threonine-protein kinase fray2 isoform X1 [Brassica napus]|uniref:serine/threonine-protein kinase fray2 isoform X1 n=1 Tax=Brassica napus TaxID=3708 RepID=UPI002078F5FA|nr:serine/threonine-protein kinase fray2 isoform X1 [Brassica napus]